MNSLVLLSGGLDSSVNLAKAMVESEVKLCLYFDYGQRAAKRELAAAIKLTQHYKVPLETVNLDFFKKITKTSLVNLEQDVPELNVNQLDDRITHDTAAKVWVPNRNGIFINIAAGYAETYNCEIIITGFNKEEAATFPDNTPEFLVAVTDSLSYSTQNRSKVISYTQDMDKNQIVKLGKELALPFEYIWSCYHGGEKMCGKCESCQRLYRALKRNNLEMTKR